MSKTQRKITALLSAALFCFLVTGTQGIAYGYPPGVPSKAQAQGYLDSLTVRGEGSMAGYSREKFPQWITISGQCDTRETVLKRDGANVTVGQDCYPTSGSWYSEYDGLTRSDPSTISIDHIVPLAEAWRSGANEWSQQRRQDFANDLDGPQLIAVTTEVNSSKGDRDPAAWMPPLQSKHCAYSKFWITTKHRWGLSLQASEKAALQTALNRCSY